MRISNKLFSHIRYSSLIKGFVSYFPFAYYIYKKKRGESSHSGSNARFCYSLWLRIVVKLYQNNSYRDFNNIAELGCSSSLGVGLMALISGVKKYTALEIDNYDNVEKNLKIFDELVKLMKKREDIPDEKEYPQINIRLNSYEFPKYIFSENKLLLLLQKERIDGIRAAISNVGSLNGVINFLSPWSRFLDSMKGSFDLIYSRAVLEHVSNYNKVYQELNIILKTNGLMIHDIEYHSHKLSKQWNGHWCYSRLMWQLLVGNRKNLINRATHTMHIDSLINCDFSIIFNKRVIKKSKLNKRFLSKKFKDISDDDIISFGGCILVTK